MYQRRSWLMSLEWSTLSLSCVWSRSEFSPFFPCQVRHLIRCFFSICVQLDFPSCCGFNPGCSSDQWGDVSIFVCVCSDRSGSFDWMAHDPEKDLCAGPQLGSPHHCPHHQSSCAALYGVSQHFREHCQGHKGQHCNSGFLCHFIQYCVLWIKCIFMFFIFFIPEKIKWQEDSLPL